jgi:hypothetical protein
MSGNPYERVNSSYLSCAMGLPREYFIIFHVEVTKVYSKPIPTKSRPTLSHEYPTQRQGAETYRRR